MIDASNVADIAIGGGISGSIVLLVARFALSRVAARLDHLVKEVERLKEERIGALEKRMDAFAGGCTARHDRLAETLAKVEHMAADLANMVGWTKRIDGKLDRIAEETSAQRSDIAGQARWLQNLDSAHQAHARDREAHRNG